MPLSLASPPTARAGDPARGVGPLGYLTQQGARFANSAMTAKWMPHGDGMPFFEDLLHDEWSHPEESQRPLLPPSSRSHGDGVFDLLRKVARALVPGGIVVIVGQVPSKASSAVGEAIARRQAQPVQRGG